MHRKYTLLKSMIGASVLCLLNLPASHAEPVTLDNSVLGQITAGNYAGGSAGSGGAIIGNSSVATIKQYGGIELEGEAQSGASGLNLVNSSESTVANGVNIWDVNTNEGDASNGQVQVEQSNVIVQEQRRSASMPNYSRPEANIFIEVIRTGSENHNDSLDRNNNIVDVQITTSDAHNESTAFVNTNISGGGSVGGESDPKLNVDTNVGKGGAGAGTLDAYLDGGEVQIGLAIGGAVIAEPDKITETSTKPSESFGGMTVGNEDSKVSLYGRLILPEAEIHIVGSGCGVLMGSCNAGGTADLKTSNTRDDSIMDTENVTSVGNSEFTENLTEIYRSPFELNHAQAEYIVVDDSSLSVETSFTLALTGSAQSNVKGMNVVNATGSAVADGINIARTSGLNSGGAMALQQSNVISHSR